MYILFPHMEALQSHPNCETLIIADLGMAHAGGILRLECRANPTASPWLPIVIVRRLPTPRPLPPPPRLFQHLEEAYLPHQTVGTTLVNTCLPLPSIDSIALPSIAGRVWCWRGLLEALRELSHLEA